MIVFPFAESMQLRLRDDGLSLKEAAEVLGVLLEHLKRNVLVVGVTLTRRVA